MQQSRQRFVSALSSGLTAVGYCVLVCFLAARNASAQTETHAQYRSYPLTHANASDVESMLTDLLRDTDPSAHVVADARKNQVLIQGTPAAHQMAQRLIQSIDRPVPPPARPAPPPKQEPVLKWYSCSAEQLESVADKLRALYGTQNGVRIATLAERSQLLVLARPDLHPIIARQLSDWGVAPSVPTQHASPPATVQANAASMPVATSPLPRTITMSVSTNNKTADQITSMLQKLLGQRLFAGVPGRSDYRFVNSEGQQLSLSVDRQRHVFNIQGDENVANQFARLVRTLDSQPTQPGQRVRVVPVRRADPTKIKQAYDAYRGKLLQKRLKQPGATPGTIVDPNRPADGSRARLPHQSQLQQGHSIQPVAFQQDAPADSAAPAESPGTFSSETDGIGIRELGSDVELETLSDLDVIILRGRDNDVDELTHIIEEIERLSEEMEPEIDIYYLKHVRGESLMTIITQMGQNLIGGKQGQVSITPLVKPNALLLIGWGEAVVSMKELIAKLDQPVEPATQFKVFRLQHAPSATVQTTVQQFFSGRTGLGPQVEVTADARSNSVIVRASPRDMEEAALLIQQIDTAESESVNQTRIVTLKYSLATDIAQLVQTAISAVAGGTGAQRAAVLELLPLNEEDQRILKSGLLNDVRITPDPRTNTLLLSAPAESMNFLEALIKQLDERPATTAQIKVFRIENGDATNMVRVLQTLLPPQAGGSTVPQLPSAEGETSLVPVRFAVDIRTNSIIASGSTGDLEIVEALLLRLDEEGFLDRQNSIYRLRNAPAVDVARAITEFLRSERQVEQSAPGADSPFMQIEREVVVVPEPVSNALIVSATPKYFDEIMELVEDLDSPPPQVMIQVLIAEVVLDDTNELGVELGLQDSILFDRSTIDNIQTVSTTISQPGQPQVTSQRVVSQEGVPGYNFNSTSALGNNVINTATSLAGQALSNFAVGRLNSESGFGGLVLSASSQSISVLIRALQETGRLEVLSRPQIMTLDNQPAYIQVGQRVPRIVGTQINQTGQVNNVTLENVGLILGVTPRISPDGTVVMDLDAENSKIGPESDGIPVSISATGEVIRSPRVDLTVAQTTISAADGQTVVLGGMISKKTSELSRKVPYLADVPVLGQLFRYDSLITTRTELLIIMTPQIVRDPEDQERLKYLEAARMHWCAADVHDLHGDPSFCQPGECPICDGQIPVVYPDQSPRGATPPAPAIPDTESTPSRISTPSETTMAPAAGPEIGQHTAAPIPTTSLQDQPPIPTGRSGVRQANFKAPEAKRRPFHGFPLFHSKNAQKDTRSQRTQSANQPRNGKNAATYLPKNVRDQLPDDSVSKP